MEPVTLSAATIATLVITKAFEKTGEELGKNVLEECGKLLSLLKKKHPETANAIELAQQEPLDYGQAILEKVEKIANSDSEIAQTIKNIETAFKYNHNPNFEKLVEKLEAAINSKPSAIHNYGKIADSLPTLKASFQGNTTIQGDLKII